MLKAAHQSAPRGLLTKPDRREMNPVVSHVFQASLMQCLLHGVMLLPLPIALGAFHRAPRDVIFVRDRTEML